jgi:hypothetical protein
MNQKKKITFGGHVLSALVAAWSRDGWLQER